MNKKKTLFTIIFLHHHLLLNVLFINLLSLFKDNTSSVASAAEQEKFTFKPPVLNEEERLSNFLPDNMVCDGCRAVGYHLFNAFNKKTNGNKIRIDEIAIYDLIETTCDQFSFKDYGIKGIGNENFLSGPGLAVAKTPGVMQGGGKNGERLARICLDSTEDKEMAIYYTYIKYLKKNNEKSRRLFSKDLCVKMNLCTGNEHEGRYDMEDKLPDILSETGGKKRRKKKKKNKKKKKGKKKGKKNKKTKLPKKGVKVKNDL